MCYANDSEFLDRQAGADLLGEYAEKCKKFIPHPVASLQLAGWTKNLTTDAQEKLQKKALFHFWEARRRDADANKENGPTKLRCGQGDCGPAESPGYPLASKEDFLDHCRHAHGCSDREIVGLVQAFQELEGLAGPPNEVKVRQMKRSSCGGDEPSAKRCRVTDVTKGKFEVIDLTDD